MLFGNYKDIDWDTHFICSSFLSASGGLNFHLWWVKHCSQNGSYPTVWRNQAPLGNETF